MVEDMEEKARLFDQIFSDTEVEVVCREYLEEMERKAELWEEIEATFNEPLPPEKILALYKGRSNAEKRYGWLFEMMEKARKYDNYETKVRELETIDDLREFLDRDCNLGPMQGVFVPPKVVIEWAEFKEQIKELEEKIAGKQNVIDTLERMGIIMKAREGVWVIRDR